MGTSGILALGARNEVYVSFCMAAGGQLLPELVYN